MLVTGGRASFGVGGYFKSEIDPYLPVSMEVKNEHRKLSLAMVVALMALEFIVAFLQAFVFAALTCTYLSDVVNLDHGH